MRRPARTPAFLPLFALLVVCCSPPVTPLEDVVTEDRAPEISADDGSIDTDSATEDAVIDAPTSDASGDGSSAGSCAAPDAGALQANYYCDTASVHVLALTGAATRVMAFARLGIGGSTACGVVDSVQITRASTLLQRVSASQAFTVGATSSLVLSATAEPALEAACSDRTGRLSAYGMIIRGRDQREPFEARCGAAESGGRWPPGLHLACHQHLEQLPMAFPPAMFTVSAVGAEHGDERVRVEPARIGSACADRDRRDDRGALSAARSVERGPAVDGRGDQRMDEPRLRVDAGRAAVHAALAQRLRDDAVRVGAVPDARNAGA